MEIVRELPLRTLLAQVESAEETVWGAFESTQMSQAREAVYHLYRSVEDEPQLSPSVKEELLPLLLEARSAIAAGETPWERVQACHTRLAKVQHLIQQMLAH
ncbi:MAG TPA: hypothetical protein VFM34_12445 [Moraxellaceae bacterium]|nr:hypothetical protein [Moraxellaceae bacterium]